MAENLVRLGFFISILIYKVAVVLGFIVPEKVRNSESTPPKQKDKIKFSASYKLAFIYTKTSSKL